jgi:hypothetical protein
MVLRHKGKEWKRGRFFKEICDNLRDQRGKEFVFS